MKVTGMPYCYYPTTVLLVDDDEKFLNILKDSVKGLSQAFTKPYEAIKFLSTVRNPTLTQMDLAEIQNCRDQPTRFDEISVLIIDYQMPGMNGIDFCKSIRKEHHSKIIMLTGEATHALAVNAFNDSIIDRFIQKSTPNLHRELSLAIADMQFKYFQGLSTHALNSLVNQAEAIPRFLQNEHFATFFKAIIKKNQVSEYYILNHFGDFMMITEQGKRLYFRVRDAQAFDDFIRFEIEPAYLEEPSPEAKSLYEPIKRKEMIPFLWDHKDQPDFVNWPVYPTESVVCDAVTFYYTIVNPDAFLV